MDEKTSKSFSNNSVYFLSIDRLSTEIGFAKLGFNSTEHLDHFCFAGGLQLSKAVETAKISLRLWRYEIPKIPNIFILFHKPQATYHKRSGIFIAPLIISPLNRILAGTRTTTTRFDQLPCRKRLSIQLI